MKVSYFLGKGSFEVRQAPELHPGPGEVVIKNMVCGVCGTDVHIFHGEPGSADVTPPVVLGHEYSGEVVEVGEGVTALKPGDHVTVDPNIYCGECVYCRNGKKQLCETMQAVGVTRDGGFGEYSLVPAAQAFKLGDSVPYEAGAMAEPVACCLHGIDLAGIKAGDRVCIVGGGAIGLIMLQLAKLSGASSLVLSEPNEKRRQLAGALRVAQQAQNIPGGVAAALGVGQAVLGKPDGLHAPVALLHIRAGFRVGEDVLGGEMRVSHRLILR